MLKSGIFPESPVSRRSFSILALLAALAAILMLWFASPAAADAGNRLKEFSVAKTTSSGVDGIPEILVVSSDGTRWDSIRAASPLGQLLSVKFKIVTKSWARITSARIVIGDCYKIECYWEIPTANGPTTSTIAGPNLFYKDNYVDKRSISRTIEQNFFPANLPISTDEGVARFPVADVWINACNAAAPAPNVDRFLGTDMPITLAAGTDGYEPGSNFAAAYGDAFHSKTIRYPVRLHCVRYRESLVGGQGELSLDPDLGKITKLDVSLKTFQNQTPENTTSPNPGTVCKKALMTVTAEASLAGTYPVNLLRKVGLDYSSDSLNMQTQFIDGKNVAFHEEWISVDDTAKVEAWVNSSADAAEQTPETTDHAELTLQCEGSGGTGGLQGDLLPFQVSADMTITSDQDGQAFPGCPRPLDVRTTVRTNRPGHFVSRLVCTGGFDRLDAHTPLVATSDAQGHKTYTTYINDTAQLTEEGTVTCAMTVTHQNGEPEQLVAVESYDGICATVRPELPPPGDAGGELTVDDPDSGPGPNTPQSVFIGNFQFIDNSDAADRDACPREAKALVWFKNKVDKNIHFSLDCQQMGSHSGVVQPEKQEDGFYTAASLVSLPITQTVSDTCILRTVSPGPPRDRATGEHTFQCVKTAGHSSDAGGLTSPDTGPSPAPSGQGASSGTPAILPQVCRGGKIRYGACLCPQGTTLKKISRSEYVCQRDRIVAPVKPVDPVRTNPTPPAPRLVCNGGQVSKGKCYCGRNKIRRKIGAGQYQCIATARPPETKKPVRVNPQLKKPRVACYGGKVSRGECTCGRNKTRKKIGNRKFQCVASAGPAKRTNPVRVNSKPKKQSVICRGGAVKGGRCRCSGNQVAKKLGAHKFACVPRRGN